MIKTKDVLILSELRHNSRESLTNISKRTKVPISTIYDKLRQYQGDLILHHSTLINFSKLGYNTRANVMIKVEREQREQIKSYLTNHQSINSVAKINNGFDYMFEGIFTNIKDMEDFMEIFESRFKILEKNVYYIIEDIKKESFMTDPSSIQGVVSNVLRN